MYLTQGPHRSFQQRPNHTATICNGRTRTNAETVDRIARLACALQDLGIGSGHSAVRDQEQAQRVLGFPDGYRAVFMIGFGYPADRPLRPLNNPNRRPFDDVVHWGRW